MKTTTLQRWMFGAVLALALHCPAAFAGYAPLPLERDQIVSVYDGDTMTITVDSWPEVFGQRLGVRISGLDAPERHSRCKDPAAKAREEEQAMQARAELLSVLDSGPPIELRNLGRDKYFRLLAEVWVGEQNVSDVLIAQGLAVPYDGGTKAGWCDPA